MTKTNFEDLRTLITATVITVWTGTAYFSQWTAMDATSGPTRLMHAVAMMAMASCCLVAIATILAVAVVPTVDLVTLLRARRLRQAAATTRMHGYRIVAPGAAIR